MPKAGIVTVVGKPNVGKSTLLNRIVGQKLSITSPKPQSTRDRIVGIYTSDDSQLVILDTPGLLKRMPAQFMVILPEAELSGTAHAANRLRGADVWISLQPG